ncbi:MAG: trypsin-like peptidase domain-containing protein, partial [Singulisphaera sp.]
MAKERIHPPRPGFKPEEYKIRGKQESDSVDPQGNRIAELDPAEIESQDIESQCGLTNESQHVEQYDGLLGIPRAFVDAHQAPVGQLQWNNNLGNVYTNPGNINGVRWCSGTLIARDLFLSAGHCFDSNPPGWVVPRTNGTNNPIPPAEIAQNMHVNFNFQRDPNGNLRAEQQIAITQLLEHRLGGLDYAIVRLAGNPGDAFGTTRLARRDPTIGEMSAIIGHPAGLPKQIEAGPITAVQGNVIRYNDTDTLGGNSGSGVLLNSEGTIVGVHTNGGCAGTNPETGFNIGQRILALRAVSP